MQGSSTQQTLYSLFACFPALPLRDSKARLPQAASLAAMQAERVRGQQAIAAPDPVFAPAPPPLQHRFTKAAMNLRGVLPGLSGLRVLPASAGCGCCPASAGRGCCPASAGRGCCPASTGRGCWLLQVVYYFLAAEGNKRY